jgi:hypothetical protein
VGARLPIPATVGCYNAKRAELKQPDALLELGVHTVCCCAEPVETPARAHGGQCLDENYVQKTGIQEQASCD